MDEFDEIPQHNEDMPPIDPRQFEEKHWRAIQALTRLIMERDKVPYYQAVVYAYIEWLELAQMDDTRH